MRMIGNIITWPFIFVFDLIAGIFKVIMIIVGCILGIVAMILILGAIFYGVLALSFSAVLFLGMFGML